MNVPSELKYTKDHEWVKIEGNVATIGITDFAQDQLGDVVFVELPEIEAEFSQGDVLGTIESTKTVSDIFAPLSGKVTAVNDELGDDPEMVNSDPFGAGWMLKMTVADPAELEALLSADAYSEHIEEE
jgi:glycine cleavage system H protein